MSPGERMGETLVRAVTPVTRLQEAPRTPMEWIARAMLSGLAASLRWLLPGNAAQSISRQPAGPTGPELIVSQLSAQSRLLLQQKLDLSAKSTDLEIARAASKPSPHGFTKFGGFLHAFELTNRQGEQLSIFVLDQLFGISNQYQYRDNVCRWNVLAEWNYELKMHLHLCPRGGKPLFRFHDAATMFGIRWKLENHGFDVPYENIYEPQDLLYPGMAPSQEGNATSTTAEEEQDHPAGGEQSAEFNYDQYESDEEEYEDDQYEEDDPDAPIDEYPQQDATSTKESRTKDDEPPAPLPLGNLDLIALEFPLREWAMQNKLKAEHLLAMCARSSIEGGITLEALRVCGLDKETAHRMNLTAVDASTMNWRPGSYDDLELPQKNPGRRYLYAVPTRPPKPSASAPSPKVHADPAPSKGRVNV
jgi:hypothetical protein